MPLGGDGGRRQDRQAKGLSGQGAQALARASVRPERSRRAAYAIEHARRTRSAPRSTRPKGSTLIDRVLFDEETDTLSIWFKASGKYIYTGVPRAIYDALKKATSAGAYFNAAIKGRFEGRAERRR